MLCTFRLTLPDFRQTGTHCINFHYHMYGFHINTLQLLKKTTSGGNSQLWQRSKEQGNKWFHAAVEIDLDEGDQVSI